MVDFQLMEIVGSYYEDLIISCHGRSHAKTYFQIEKQSISCLHPLTV